MRITFEGVFNFRDLGGHHSQDGRVVAHGRLYRADDLSTLTEQDGKAFAELGIRTVVDLRRPNEIEEVGRIADFDGVTYHNLHLVHPKWERATHPDTADRLRFLGERYREMAEHGGAAIGGALRLIADPRAAPLVMHCLAGKDRTGIVAALTLSLLGVSDGDVADDYHLSDLAEEPAWERYAQQRGYPPENPRAHIEVSPRRAILGFLEDLRSQHGTIAGYAGSIGVRASHLAAMRAHLLVR